MAGDMILEVLERAARTGDVEDRLQALQAIKLHRQQNPSEDAQATPLPRRSRKRVRSPSPPKAVHEDDFEVDRATGRPMASTGPIEQDQDLEILEWACKRGGIRQRMKAYDNLQALRVRQDQERQLREAAQIGSKTLVQNILGDLQKRAGDGSPGVDMCSLHDGHTALWHAIAGGHYDAAKALLAAGASPHFRMSSIHAKSPFEMAKAHLETVHARDKNHWKAVLAMMQR